MHTPSLKNCRSLGLSKPSFSRALWLKTRFTPQSLQTRVQSLVWHMPPCADNHRSMVGGRKRMRRGEFSFDISAQRGERELLSVKGEQCHERDCFDSSTTKSGFNAAPARGGFTLQCDWNRDAGSLLAGRAGILFLLKSRRQHQPLSLRNVTENTSSGITNREDLKAGTPLWADYASCLTSRGRYRCRRGLADRVPKGVPSSEPCPKSNNVQSAALPAVGLCCLQPT